MRALWWLMVSLALLILLFAFGAELPMNAKDALSSDEVEWKL